MRKTLPAFVEKGRVGGDPGSGPHGAFRLLCDHLCRSLAIIASDGREWATSGLPSPAWEHVSVSAATSVPAWAEMCWVKELFWEPEEEVVQFHPPASRYVNIHPRVLHLWRPVGVVVPMPPIETV